MKESNIMTFVKDLSNSNVTNISQIRWIFDHDKMSSDVVKTKVLAALQTNKGSLETLSENKKVLYFPNYKDTIGITDKDIQDFISLNFNQIFP